MIGGGGFKLTLFTKTDLFVEIMYNNVLKIKRKECRRLVYPLFDTSRSLLLSLSLFLHIFYGNLPIKFATSQSS